MKYRELRGYKYELTDCVHAVAKKLPPPTDVGEHRYIAVIDDNGDRLLAIFKGYAWDGASGPTFDDKTNMRASLVHDALYQLMREKLLDRKHRKYADELFRDICIEDGMGKFRAWYYYQAVRIFGAKTSLPEKNKRGQIIEV